LPQLAACVILKFYLNVPYRDMEDWLLASDQVCQVLDLKTVPDYCTLARTFRKLNKTLLDEMQHQLLEAAFLAPYPATLLPLDKTMQRRLPLLGIDTLGQLTALHCC
jgi:hypothetical protein